MNKVKLSELTLKTDVLRELKYGEMQLLDVEELLYNIAHNEYGEDLFTKYNFYIAEPTPHKWSIRSDLMWLLEANCDDEYEDWDQDMYEDLKDAPETIAFFELLNKVSENRLTYYPVAEIELDLENLIINDN